MGEIIEEDEQMFYLIGKFILADAFKASTDPFAKKLQKYIEYSIRLNTRREQISDSADEVDRISQEGKQYMDLSKSDEWYVLSEKTGHRNHILAPGFSLNNKVTLRIIH